MERDVFLNTKLIVVEGLPGFGKSTTAKLICDILLEKHIDAELFLEGDLDHPADYDGVSCFNENEFVNLLAISENLKELISDSVTKSGSDYLLSYRKMEKEHGFKIPDHLLDAFFNRDIYELPLEKNMELITEKWREFTARANNENKTYIFECCFIQNPLTIGMVKYDEQKEKVAGYVHALAEITEKLNPVLFYIEQDDLEFSFRKAVNERTKEWSAGFVEYYTNQGYGKMKGYRGLDGTIKVLKARSELEREIFDTLKIKKIKINNSHYEIARYKSKLTEKLNLFEVLG